MGDYFFKKQTCVLAVNKIFRIEFDIFRKPDTLLNPKVPPHINSFAEITLYHKGAVNRSDRGTGHCFILDAKLFQSLPCTDLVNLSCSSACRCNCIFFHIKSSRRSLQKKYSYIFCYNTFYSRFIMPSSKCHRAIAYEMK